MLILFDMISPFKEKKHNIPIHQQMHENKHILKDKDTFSLLTLALLFICLVLLLVWDQTTQCSGTELGLASCKVLPAIL